MPASKTTTPKNNLTPCRREKEEWPICYENNCYQNYCCPAYRGKFPSPVRDYIPLPPVFILVSPDEAIPFFYQIQVTTFDSEEEKELPHYLGGNSSGANASTPGGEG